MSTAVTSGGAGAAGSTPGRGRRPMCAAKAHFAGFDCVANVSRNRSRDRSMTHGSTLLVFASEGWRSQDDLYPEPASCSPNWANGCSASTSSSGQPDHESGHRSRRSREEPLRRPGPSVCRSTRSSCPTRSTSPRRPSTWPAPRRRSPRRSGRERALEKALKPIEGVLLTKTASLKFDISAVAWAAHHQRPGGLRRRDRAGAMRVSRCAACFSSSARSK